MSRKYTGLPYTEYTTADGHFDTNRAPITKIVLHSSASTRQGLIDTFGGGTRMVSAQYGVDNDGFILAFVEEYYTAYHAGNYAVNESSIGIEHIDNGATVKLHTDAQYTTSIKLVADICRFYNIPVDSLHIVPHSSIVATACPNGLDVNRIIEGAKALLAPVVVPLPIPTPTYKTKFTFIQPYGELELQQVESMLVAKDKLINDQIQTIGNQAIIVTTLQKDNESIKSELTTLKQTASTPTIIKVPEASNVPNWIRRLFNDSV